MSAPRATNLSSRRRILAALGALGVPAWCGLGAHSDPVRAATSGTATGTSCVLSPRMTEGPYFVDQRLNRSDLTSGSSRAGVVQGMPLALAIDLQRVMPTGCIPFGGVQVNVWHCDATGEYSDEPAGMGQSGTEGQKFLRGYQVSDASGRVTFKTIYPGWYPGRTIHIHLKARTFAGNGSGAFEFTTQLFFDDAVSDAVMAAAPYNARGRRVTRNANERIFANQASALVVLARAADGARGYAASATLGLTG